MLTRVCELSADRGHDARGGGDDVDVHSAHVDVEERLATTVERADAPLLKRRCKGTDRSWSGAGRRTRGTAWRDERGPPWRVSSARQDARCRRTRASQPKPRGRKARDDDRKVPLVAVIELRACLRRGHAALVATQRATQDDLESTLSWRVGLRRRCRGRVGKCVGGRVATCVPQSSPEGLCPRTYVAARVYGVWAPCA